MSWKLRTDPSLEVSLFLISLGRRFPQKCDVLKIFSYANLCQNIGQRPPTENT